MPVARKLTPSTLTKPPSSVPSSTAGAPPAAIGTVANERQLNGTVPALATGDGSHTGTASSGLPDWKALPPLQA